jgi:GNAT superfamily N-acetyltransferase
VNEAHNAYHKDRIGFFGFFDCIDDEEVARALLTTARNELKKRGMDRMRGPYNPSINDEFGLLVEGFDSIPAVMMPYNPPYYLDLYAKLGLQKAKDFFAFYISGSSEAPARILKICERVRRTTGLTVRPVNLKNLSNELKILHKLYNETLDRNWGYVPISMEDLEYAAADLKAIVDPELVMIAEKNGEPVGFSMCIPNINEILWRTKKNGTLVRMVKFLWGLKVRGPKEARLAALGVAPEFRGKGVAALFYAETLLKGGKKFQGGELSWVEETNEEIIKGIAVMGGHKYKTYRIYEAALA